MDPVIQKITTNLWFDMNAEEAVDFYTSVFNNSKIGRVTYYSGVGNESHRLNAGKVMTIEFQIEGQGFLALNGSPAFPYTEAISFIINCESQEEVDHYWDKLTQGSDKRTQMCGWLTDRFGITWQVVPIELNNMLIDGEAKKVERLTNALMKMKKLDLKELLRAYEEE
ncbi:3-demethylubiquinone-9 3-methyltransferase [Planococcus donghaensis MPA1U2]|uniref:3-demethylubiquinone-9 3-methyltransferase n=1 Tax=Planococcus donghaensis MPA1U2 TaxID=933115 RepID=E7RH36_9BACL|nr:VOC family protein [Planococcus donghaensis]EGA89774.1 3-demethylubiquinone-9 3-methyltransferase [Planococcus donghaensis MPA1U2]